MFAEAYLHDLLAKNCPIDGLRIIDTNEAALWEHTATFGTADGKTCSLDTSAATDAQVAAAGAVIAIFNYAAVESALAQINELEGSVTNRMRDDAIAGDTSINPAWCGNTGGTAAEQLAYINQQKAALRAGLPK